ncbi:MAG TPA: TonB-dependent receptor [Candidatus Baltobacteraceae bacterium]|nr:TonB-dependent receptor [Candidatus Baltobacteraceae bacterium]
MKHLLRRWRLAAGILAAAVLCTGLVAPQAAYAGTTGNISGTVTDASGKAVADVAVTAASASQTASTTTDAHGFYSIVNLSADTYTVSFQKQGFQALSAPGVTVFQDQTITVNEKLQTELKVIASVHAAGASNLVKSNQGSDVYNVSGAQLKAATNPVDTHETLYQYLAVTPGVTGTGFPSQPRVRGGQVTDLGYEFEGIPIQDRITGFFTTNLSNIGINNIEVYTGGLPASGSTNGTGYFNSVLKTGTYPGFTNLAVQATSPSFNNFLTFERGGGTADHKFTYYVGLDVVNSQNQYDYGERTYPNVLMWGYNGPGQVKTRDWVSNFIYRPTQKDALQFVYTNSLGEFVYDYLLNKSGQDPALAFNPCAGAVMDSTTATGASGGTAPNGSPCPVGLYWGALPNHGGNIWHHYGALGKLQWNHNINDHSFFNLRVAENFNQYIFDQPMADPNIPAWENAGGGYNWAQDVLGLPSTACPSYPYASGTPVVTPTGDPYDLCAFYDGVEVFWGDRRSNMFFGNFDYTNVLSSNITVKAGVNHERDNNVFNYFLTNGFGGPNAGADGTPAVWPDNYLHSIYPTIENTFWGEADIHAGKFLLDPGVAYATEHYGFPGGGATYSVVNPTFNGTYTFDPNNVLRFSYGKTSSFVGSGYVYRTGSSLYNGANVNASPQRNTSADLMFEHNFGNNTTLRFGPWMNRAYNYYENYKPIVGYNANGTPRYGKAQLQSTQSHNAAGFEFALNHLNTADRGTSFWLSATYDNYWTTSTALAGSFVNGPLPANIVSAGNYVRATGNPLFSGTLVADYHSGRFHFDPLLYYQTLDAYNVGVISYCTTYVTTSASRCAAHSGTVVPPFIAQNEQWAGAYWKAKITAYEELGPTKNFILGFSVDNLFDNTNDVTPCNSDGTGCFPFDGAQSGINTPAGNSNNPVYIYQNYSQSPRTFYFFAGVKL